MTGGEIGAICYADIFDYPLTPSESKLWVVAGLSNKFSGAPSQKDGYLFLPGRENLVEERKKREKILDQKISLAKKIVISISRLPTILAIFLTGSVAAGNPKDDADVDLLIVTLPGTMWITRLLVVIYLKLIGHYPAARTFDKRLNRVCPNLYLDSRHLIIHEKNLYLAHEIIQAKCSFDRGGFYKEWLAANLWTRELLPAAYDQAKKSVFTQKTNFVTRLIMAITGWCCLLLFPLEAAVCVCQYLYQKPRQTNEKVGWGYAFFHPDNLSVKVCASYKERIEKLGYTG